LLINLETYEKPPSVLSI